MGSNANGYTPDEIDAIAKWLRNGDNAMMIAQQMSRLRGVPVSRNAIIGIVRRNKVLDAIGFARTGHSRGGHGVSNPTATKEEMRRRQARNAAAPMVKPAKLHPSNIRGKKEGRALDPVYAPPRPKPVDDGISPHVYDATARHVPLVDLRHGECRFAVNDAAQGEQHLFCGRAAGFASYCPHHARRVGARPVLVAEAA